MDQVVKKIKLTNANFAIANPQALDTKTLMQSEAQRIFNQYSHVVKDEKKFQIFNQFTQQTNTFLKRMEEHQSILKNQLELQVKICQNQLQLQKAQYIYSAMEKQ